MLRADLCVMRHFGTEMNYDIIYHNVTLNLRDVIIQSDNITL